MIQLPKWLLLEKYPAFYDVESATAIEQTARLYGVMRDLISDYNSFIEKIEKSIIDFETGTDKDLEEFKVAIRQEFQDFIDNIHLRYLEQDNKLNKAVRFMTDNIQDSIITIIDDMKNSGELSDVIMTAFDNLNTRLTQEIENINTQISQEIEARKQAINEEASARKQAIQEEASARKQAIQEEAEAREVAIQEEAEAREVAIQEEANTRETQIKNLPFNNTDTFKENYKEMSAKCVASYLSRLHFCNSVVGSIKDTTPKPVICVYDNEDGHYLGLLGSRTFKYMDTQVINGVEYSVMYANCGAFVSLITKGIEFDDSPYHYAFTLGREDITDDQKKIMREKALERGGTTEEYSWTFDHMNNGAARYSSYIMDRTGNTLKQISEKTSNGELTIDPDVIATLETGDIIYNGNTSKDDSGSYNGIVHIAYYVKDLEDLNKYGDGVTFKPYNDDSHIEYGYVVECVDSSDDDNNYTDCIRIRTLYERMNVVEADGSRVFVSKPQTSVLQSNKLLKLLLNIEKNYDLIEFFDNNFHLRNKMGEIDVTYGDLIFNSIGAKGSQYRVEGNDAFPTDLNLMDKVGVWVSYHLGSTFTNIPPECENNFFTLINLVNRGSYNLRYQIFITAPQTASSKPKIYIRNKGFSQNAEVWTEWLRLDNQRSSHAITTENITVSLGRCLYTESTGTVHFQIAGTLNEAFEHNTLLKLGTVDANIKPKYITAISGYCEGNSIAGYINASGEIYVANMTGSEIPNSTNLRVVGNYVI